MDRAAVTALILEQLTQWDFPDPTANQAGFTDETILFGRDGLLDSIGLVSFVMDLEEAIHRACGVTISLVNERALSQNRSPFRQVSSLAEYAATLIAEQTPGS